MAGLPCPRMGEAAKIACTRSIALPWTPEIPLHASEEALPLGVEGGGLGVVLLLQLQRRGEGASSAGSST